MPIVSNASNKQMNVGKIQIKGRVTMATFHGSPPPGTCHTDLSVENKEHKRTYLKPEPRSFKDQEVGGRGRTKSSKATPSKPRGQNYVAMA